KRRVSFGGRALWCRIGARCGPTIHLGGPANRRLLMPPLSRRGFIHSSIGVAAGSTLLGSLSSLASAQANAQPADDNADKAKAAPEEKKVPPSDRLRMAVIGCGGRGESHVNAWSGMDDVELGGLCDPDGARVGQYAYKVENKQGHTPTTYEDMRRIFDDKSID